MENSPGYLLARRHNGRLEAANPGMKRRRTGQKTPKNLHKRTKTAPRTSKKRSRSMTRTKRQLFKKQKPDDSGQLYSKASYKFGRYKSKSLRNLYKTVNNNLHSNVLVYRALSPFTSVGGSTALRNIRAGAAGTYTYEFPIHMFDLTCASNVINGVFVPGSPSYKVLGSETPASGYSPISFGNVDAISTETGGSLITWKTEATSGSTSNAIGFVPHNHSILKWADIKLICHGAKNYPTKYDISLVQFKRRSVVPIANSAQPVTVEGDTGDIDEFYNYLYKPYTYSTIATEGATKFRKYFKTLKRVNFILQPRDTSDSGSVTPFKELKIFQKFDRGCWFDWSGENTNPAGTDTVAIPNSNLAPNYTSREFSTSVYPTKRIFLMIRATSEFQSATPAQVTDVWPTYDFSIRTKHVFQN